MPELGAAASASPPARSADRLAWAVLAVAMAIDAALVLWVTRGTTVFVDELDLLAVDRGLEPTALLTPLNGHLVLLQRTLWAVTGPDFVVLRVVEAVGVVVVVGLLFALLWEGVLGSLFEGIRWLAIGAWGREVATAISPQVPSQETGLAYAVAAATVVTLGSVWFTGDRLRSFTLRGDE